MFVSKIDPTLGEETTSTSPFRFFLLWEAKETSIRLLCFSSDLGMVDIAHPPINGARLLPDRTPCRRGFVGFNF